MSSMQSRYTRVSGEETRFTMVRGNLLGYENKPHEIQCEIYYNSWVDMINSLLSFNIKRAGFLFIPYGTILLNNEDGYFTSGTYEIATKRRRMRIRAKLRNTWYELLDGGVHRINETFELAADPSETVMEVLLRSYNGQVLLNDTITKNYADEGFTCRQAIDHLLQNPDSGCDTGLRLITDEGPIHTIRAPENFDKTKLVNAIKATANHISYDGYLMDQANYVVLKELPTVAASPPISYFHPFIKLQPEFDIDEVYNHIHVWGQTDLGFPVDDLWCEYGVKRYEPVAWSGMDANSEVTDDETYKHLGDNSIRVTRKNGVGVPGAILDITKTGYNRPQDQTKHTIDLNASTNPNYDRFSNTGFQLRLNDTTDIMWIKLFDSTGKGAEIKSADIAHPTSEFIPISKPVDYGHHADWTIDVGFNWSDVAKIRIKSGGDYAVGWFFNIDELHFAGGNFAIDPLTHSYYNPAHIDATSISNYGRKLYNEIESQPACFEDAYIIGEIVLSIYKNPFKKLKITQGFKPWLMPHNIVKLTLPEWDIYNDAWRVMGITHDWNSDRKICHTETEIVPALWKIPTNIALKARLGGFLRVASRNY